MSMIKDFMLQIDTLLNSNEYKIELIEEELAKGINDFYKYIPFFSVFL